MRPYTETFLLPNFVYGDFIVFYQNGERQLHLGKPVPGPITVGDMYYGILQALKSKNELNGIPHGAQIFLKKDIILVGDDKGTELFEYAPVYLQYKKGNDVVKKCVAVIPRTFLKDE